MKITFIGHAAILQESRGVTVLSDPWWEAPCFGAQWWNYPRAKGELVDPRTLNYIYISHGHHDHLHPGTLGRFDRATRIIIPCHTEMGPVLRKLGFPVIEVGADEKLDLGHGVHVRVMPTHGHDSLMALDDGEEVCVNLNDALHSAPEAVQQRFIEKLRSMYQKMDYVFCGYGVASHFPNCYRLPGKDREATAALRQRHFNAQWAGIVARLNPRFGFPFAADVVYLDKELFWANEPTHNAERPTTALQRLYPEFRGTAIDIAPGFQIEGGRISELSVRQAVSATTLQLEMRDEIARANRFGLPDRAAVQGICELLTANIEKCSEYLQSCPVDYRMLIRFDTAAPGILVEKRARVVRATVVEDSSKVASDIVFTTRPQYLRTSLTREFGHETIFVGSGGTFEYTSRRIARRRLHQELRVMIRMHESPPMRRIPPNALIASLKNMVKRVLGRREQDLYDLETWTVWGSDDLT